MQNLEIQMKYKKKAIVRFVLIVPNGSTGTHVTTGLQRNGEDDGLSWGCDCIGHMTHDRCKHVKLAQEMATNIESSILKLEAMK